VRRIKIQIFTKFTELQSSTILTRSKLKWRFGTVRVSIHSKVSTHRRPHPSLVRRVMIVELLQLVVATTLHTSQWRRNLFGRHGQSRTTFSGGTALNVNCRTTFQAHETFNHHVSDSQSQQTELTNLSRCFNVEAVAN